MTIDAMLVPAGLASVLALGAPAPAAPPDNFVHAPGTVTAPLGELGHVAVKGQGPIDVVLLPGAAFGGNVFAGFMERNAERYTMYAVTPSGYDGTPPPPMPESNEDFTGQTWTDALLDGIVRMAQERRLDRPIVVGHHMLGDHYALRLGLEHPDLFRGVVVIAGAPHAPLPAFPRGADEEVRAATPEQRAALLAMGFTPMMRTIDADRWRSSSYQAVRFSRDDARAQALFEAQIAVPVPTQVRYFLEYMHRDLVPQLDELAVPVLAVHPDIDESFVAAFEAARGYFTGLGMDDDAARAMMTQQMTMMWGSVERALEEASLRRQWEAMQEVVPDLRLEIVEDSRLFVQDDQPERLDALVAEFAQRVR